MKKKFKKNYIMKTDTLSIIYLITTKTNWLEITYFNLFRQNVYFSTYKIKNTYLFYVVKIFESNNNK